MKKLCLNTKNLQFVLERVQISRILVLSMEKIGGIITLDFYVK